MTELSKPEHEASYRAHLAHFDRDAHVMVDGKRYALSEADLDEIARSAQYYVYFPTGLNSSVYARTVSLAKLALRPPLARAQIIALCAATLRTTVEQLEQSLSWTANYMAFHDGGDPEQEHPYPPSEA